LTARLNKLARGIERAADQPATDRCLGGSYHRHATNQDGLAVRHAAARDPRETGRVRRWNAALSCVYTMRMARVNVYLPDHLADQAKDAGLNVSNLTQEAVRSALSANSTGQWLDEVAALPPTGVGHEDVLAAIQEAKDELESLG
jgi:post-segregation antitoxin (ccd killing protein)